MMKTVAFAGVAADNAAHGSAARKGAGNHQGKQAEFRDALAGIATRAQPHADRPADRPGASSWLRSEASVLPRASTSGIAPAVLEASDPVPARTLIPESVETRVTKAGLSPDPATSLAQMADPRARDAASTPPGFEMRDDPSRPATANDAPPPAATPPSATTTPPAAFIARPDEAPLPPTGPKALAADGDKEMVEPETEPAAAAGVVAPLPLTNSSTKSPPIAAPNGALAVEPPRADQIPPQPLAAKDADAAPDPSGEVATIKQPDPEAMSVAMLIAATAPPPRAERIVLKPDPDANAVETRAEADAPAVDELPRAAAVKADSPQPSPLRDLAEADRPSGRTIDRNGAAGPTSEMPATDAGAARVSVIERPAPIQPQALPPLSPPALSVVSAVTGDAAWMAHAAPVEASSDVRPGAARPVGELRIQLNPVELGVVTARLKLDDGVIAVTIEVQSADALHKLNGDRDAIERALRSVGLDVGSITIQQAQQSGQQGSANQNAADGRGGQQPSAQQQNAGQSGANTGSGQGNGNDARRSGMESGEAGGRAQGAAAGDRARGGVYI